MIKGRDIICISGSDWEKPWGSKQQLMLRFARENRVLYVEYQGSFWHLLRYPRYFFGRIRSEKNNLRKVSDNIYVYTPPTTLPFAYYSIFINRLNQMKILRSVKKAADKLGFRKPILWIYPPRSFELAGKLGEDLVVYHCGADYINEKKNPLRKMTAARMEERLARKSDVIFTLTKGLYERLKKINDNTVYLPSAADVEAYFKVLSQDCQEPADIASINKPRLGIIAYLDGNIIDTQLVEYLANKRPGWSIVFIGPFYRRTARFEPLKKIKNIKFLGAKRPQEVPYYVKALDVCLIPYRLNKFTQNVSPIKLYEYLAMAKPIVSTDFLPELKEYKPCVKISTSKEEFINAIDEALNEPDKYKDMRINIAKNNSWDNRYESISNALNKAYEVKNA